MTYGLVQRIKAEESTSVQWVSTGLNKVIRLQKHQGRKTSFELAFAFFNR